MRAWLLSEIFYQSLWSLLQISEFYLYEKYQRNASKFAIFYVYLLFPFFISCYFIFFPYDSIDHGIIITQRKKQSGHDYNEDEIKTDITTLTFCKHKTSFRQNFSSITNPEIERSVVQVHITYTVINILLVQQLERKVWAIRCLIVYFHRILPQLFCWVWMELEKLRSCTNF